MTFQDLLDHLESNYFISLIMTTKIHQAIISIHEHYVLQILKSGWMYQTLTEMSSTSMPSKWKKRWFVHKPGKLIYFTESDLTVKEGEIILVSDNSMKIERIDSSEYRLEDCAGLLKLSVTPSLEIMFLIADMDDLELWFKSLQNDINTRALIKKTPVSEQSTASLTNDDTKWQPTFYLLSI